MAMTRCELHKYLTFQPNRNIFRRKGGGGGRGGGGGKAGSSSKGSVNIAGSGRSSITVVSGGEISSARPYGSGGGKKYIIPAQHPFAGREAGGGTRSQVYGTSTYGSGYPGISGPGVEHRGFPFIFYPIVFALPLGVSDHYLYRENEYGSASDASRPGGPLHQFTISSSISTFHVIADNSTALFLQPTIEGSCHNATNFSISSLTPYNSSQPPISRPEQAIQYYRASSVALALDGYNNTVALGANPSAASTPLPNNIDTNLMNCINQTIGTSVPLIGSAYTSFAPSSLVLVCFVCLIWCLGDV